KAHYHFAGRVAVVTGGLNGIGAQIAVRLKAMGATVCIWDMAPHARGDGDQYDVDVTDLRAVTQAAGDVHTEHGRLDMLINSAGISGPTVPLASYDPEMWAKVIAVNL